MTDWMQFIVLMLGGLLALALVSYGLSPEVKRMIGIWMLAKAAAQEASREAYVKAHRELNTVYFPEKTTGYRLMNGGKQR